MSFFFRPAITLLLTCTFGLLYAQDRGRIEFQISDHDFGEIKEEDGPVTYTFEFTNTGNAPLLIARVKASCGCTTPDWTREPVLPGEKGMVQAQYNPRNRPGNFRKSLTITSDGDPAVTHAYIRGTVIPRIKTIEEKMPYLVGKIRFERKNLNVGRITTEKKLERSFDVYNDSEDTVSFIEKYEGPNFIQVNFDPMTLLPKQIGKINMIYDPVHEDHLGANNHGIKLYTNESDAPAKDLSVTATITEYFPPMTEEEKANAPRLSVADRLQDLGQVQEGSKTTTQFVLTNTGNTKLNIRQVKSNCACFIAELEAYDIKPGKSTVLKATFDASGRRGNQNKSITIYSGDPLDPTQVVSIKASVVRSN